MLFIELFSDGTHRAKGRKRRGGYRRKTDEGLPDAAHAPIAAFRRYWSRPAVFSDFSRSDSAVFSPHRHLRARDDPQSEFVRQNGRLTTPV